MRNHLLGALLLLALPALAAERLFDFSAAPEGKLPPGFRSVVTGQGKPGDWQVFMDEVPSLLPSLTPGAKNVAKKAVLAQLAQDPTDEHFPLLIYDAETLGDFTFTTRFKTVKGVVEQMAGIAFRIQNPTNYYVVRASSLGNTFRFYKIMNGDRGPVVGPEVQIPSGTWHEMTVECKGNDIKCRLDGKELITATDKINPFLTGKIGFWTKSDSVSYFGDSKLTYTPLQPPAQPLLRDTVKNYPRLLGLQIFVRGVDPQTTVLVASKNTNEVGRAGSRIELDVINNGTPYYGKEKASASVVVPLRDRNGDPVAAVRVIMKPSAGQDEQTAFARAMPIVKEMEHKISSIKDLVQ